VVGSTALAGSIRNAKKGMIEYRTAIVFAIPAFIAVFLTRKFIIPSIPDILFNFNNFVVSKDLAIMVFFAILMLFASISMIKGRKEVEVKKDVKFSYPLIIIEGFVVGILTGLVGAGGGFLIIPALVLFANLPMKRAVATSLLIIAVKSLFGFLGDIGNVDINWDFLLSFTSLSVVGIIIGIWLNNFIDGKKLKRAFGYFVLIMSIFIIVKELNG